MPEPEYLISPSHCAVCDHHFAMHKNGGECTKYMSSSWCDCHSYCSPRPITPEGEAHA